MEAASYLEDVKSSLSSFRLQIQDEKRDIEETQKKFENLVNTFSQKAPSTSVINSLFKDVQPVGFVFSDHEGKRKRLAEQRRAEYNAYLEKKEAQRLAKQRMNKEMHDARPKSILESVDYERVLAKRKVEEAKFRNVNIADVLHHSEPVLSEGVRQPDTNMLHSSNHPSDVTRLVSGVEELPRLERTGGGGDPLRDSFGNLLTVRGLRRERNYDSGLSLPSMQPTKDRSVSYREELQKQIEEKRHLEALQQARAQEQEERIAQRIKEQRLKMLEEYDNKIKKNNKVKEEPKEWEKSRAIVGKSSEDLEERIAKRLEEQRREMLLAFENELRKNNMIQEEIETTKPSNSAKRLVSGVEELPRLERTGGGGDPLRDSFGNLLTVRGLKRERNYDSGLSLPSMQPTKDRSVSYREELQKQIEEKQHLEALERAKAQEQEERITKRIEEQRLKMLEEYENEIKKNNKVKEEFQRQQERIRKLEEFQRKDAENRRKNFAEVKAPPPEKIQPPIIQERSDSPPIPAMRTKVLLEKAAEVVPEVKPENLYSSLAKIRSKIREERQKPKNNLKNSYKVMNRRTVEDLSDEEDDDLLQSSPNSNRQYSA